MSTPVNAVLFQSIVCMGCPAQDLNYITAALGQTGIALGDQKQGEGDDMLLDSTSTNVAKHLVRKEKQVIHMRNVSVHPIFVRCFEVLARRDISSTDASYTDPRHIACHDFAVGCKDYMASGSSTTTSYEGDGIITYTPGQIVGSLRSKFLGPKNSPRFNQNWRIVKQAKYKLGPGDDVFWKMKTKDHIYDPEKDVTDNGSGLEDARHIRKGLTKTLLIFAHGAMGSIADDAATMGFMKSSLCIDVIQSASVMPLNFGERQTHMTVGVDADSGLGALVGPAYHADAADEV